MQREPSGIDCFNAGMLGESRVPVWFLAICLKEDGQKDALIACETGKLSFVFSTSQ